MNKAEEDSDNLYEINMSGSDPEGKSTLEGFASFQEDKMEIALALTHHKHQRREESPVYYFEGVQKSQSENIVEGEWWVEGQQGTSGDYSGNWTF